jgi:hypothetical protein
MKKRFKKLTLSKETLRQLGEGDLVEVAGDDALTGGSCPSATISYGADCHYWSRGGNDC